MVTASLSVRFLSGDRDTEMFLRSFGTETFFVSYPINWTSRALPADTLMENLPSASVEVPLVVPGTSTKAPGKGSPLSSTTVPVTVIVPCCPWASAKTGHNKTATTKIRISLIFIMSYFWLKVGINFPRWTSHPDDGSDVVRNQPRCKIRQSRWIAQHPRGQI